MWTEKQLAGGRAFTKEQILKWWKDNFEVKAANAVDRMRSGRITLAEFSEWGYDELKNTLYGIAGTGAGRKLTRKEIYQVRRVLKEQNKYWENFAQSIADQRKALAAKGLKGTEFDEAFDKLHDKWGRRAQSYSGAIAAEGTKWAMAAEFPDGSWWRWTKTPVESCETCIGRDGEIHQMKDGRLPFYPKNGSTICFFQADKVRALTRERGFIRLASVVVGEHVLAHTGKWRKVSRLTKVQLENCPAVSLEIRIGKRIVKVMTTPNHLFRAAGGGWIRADQLVVGELLARIGKQCEREGCEKIVSLARNGKFCSHHCATVHGKKWEAMNRKIREMVVDGTDPLTRWRAVATDDELAAMRKKAGETRARTFPRLGRTYEELYGEAKAKSAKEKLAVARRGKSWEEVFGEERAVVLRKQASERLLGGRAAEMRALATYVNPWSNMDPQKAAEIKSRLSAATQRQWDEDYEGMRQRIIDGMIRYRESGRWGREQTAPEVAMAAILSNMGIRFDEQVWLLGKFCVDFFLVDYKIVVEADGEYWHNYPHGKLTDKARDEEIQTEKGFEVLRFWAKQILKSPEAVEAQLTRVICNHTGKYVLVGDATVLATKRVMRSGMARCLVVEGDESFVVTAGLVSHNCLYNCMCFWDPIAKPPSGRRKKLGPMGARRRGKKLREKSETEMFNWDGTAVCGICGRSLTDPTSVMKGVGPVCEKHMGPGAHPSGSPQQVHAGAAGAKSDIASKKLSAPPAPAAGLGKAPPHIVGAFKLEDLLDKSVKDRWAQATLEERAELKAKVARDLAKAAGVTEEEAADFVGQWAHSSNDNDMRSLAIQQDAAKEFGVKTSAFTLQKIAGVKEVKEKRIRDLKEDTGLTDEQIGTLRWMDMDKPLMESTKQRAILRSMYNETQAELKARGITEVKLSRGIKLEVNDVERAEWVSRVQDPLSSPFVQIETNSMESWSVSEVVAADFGRAKGSKIIGVVLEAVVPAERILAIPTTGFGCLTEGEIVVLGGVSGDVAKAIGLDLGG